MAKVIITKDSPLTSEEFKKLLKQIVARDSAIENIVELMRDLIALEREYNMPSDVFYARFMRGEMGDDLPFIMWAGQYELYLESKHEIESQIAQVPTPA